MPVSREYLLVLPCCPQKDLQFRQLLIDQLAFLLDYIPILISTGIIEIVKENIGRIVVENNSDTFKKVNEEEWESGKYDYDIVKTTLLRKNFTNLTEKKESDFK